MKRWVALLTVLVLLMACFVPIAYSQESNTQKAKYIDSIEIDDTKISSTTSSLVEIYDCEQNVTTSAFVISGKTQEGTQISIYLKKNRKDAFKSTNLVDRFEVGKTGYFVKKLDLDAGISYMLIVSTKDKDIQINLLKANYDKKEGLLTKIEKTFNNFFNSFNK